MLSQWDTPRDCPSGTPGDAGQTGQLGHLGHLGQGGTEAMSERQRLPNRRGSELLTFDHAGFQYVACTSRYGDGRLGEIFLNVLARGGTPIEIVAAIVASIALQHGASMEAIRHALSRNSDGSASGPLGALLDKIVAEPDR